MKAVPTVTTWAFRLGADGVEGVETTDRVSIPAGTVGFRDRSCCRLVFLDEYIAS